MSAMPTLDTIDVSGKRVLLRLDLNVPVENAVVTDVTRITRALPTLRELTDKGAQTIVLSHFGRPKGRIVPEYSLQQIVPALQQACGQSIKFIATDWQDIPALKTEIASTGETIILLENTRFHPGEEQNDPVFAQQVASLGDLYVNDAFSAAHRAHMSTAGLAEILPSVAGRALQAELETLTKVLANPARPLCAIIGGAKISTKLDLLANLARQADHLIIAGAMANTFLAAKNKAIGKSLYEPDLLDTTRDIIAHAKQAGRELVLPVDVVVAEKLETTAETKVVSIENVSANDMILDVGPKTLAALEKIFARSKTLVWNGPLGAFETPPFDAGTSAAAKAVARLTQAQKLCSIAGGGDTVAALNKAGVSQHFSYISTAGGAFLQWLEGKPLPGITALQK